jgi:phosphatidylserine decarboxylase
VVFLALFASWRFYYFFRDPDRTPPPGDDVLSPADGVVVYVHHVRNDEVPIAVKKRRSILLSELLGVGGFAGEGVLIGIFMYATDVHVNRLPIDGRVRDRIYRPAPRNRTMARLFANLLLGERPYAQDCAHLIENERNTIVIDGTDITVAVTQIADAFINRIACRVAAGDLAVRGARYGMIRMGSQVDVLITPAAGVKVLCREGQRTRAGETVLATRNAGA